MRLTLLNIVLFVSAINMLRPDDQNSDTRGKNDAQLNTLPRLVPHSAQISHSLCPD